MTTDILRYGLFIGGYVGMPHGLVVHTVKSIDGQLRYREGKTICGIRFNVRLWFESGIDPYGTEIPMGSKMCKKCKRP